MKKLALFTLFVAIVSQATGCIITSDDDGGGGGGTAYITANWDFKLLDGTQLQCPTGFDTAALYSQQVDPVTFGNDAAVVIDLFTCDAFHGVSDGLNPTTHYSWVQIQNHDGTQTYAQTPEAFVDLTDADKTFSANIYDDAGYFQLAWQLQDAGGPTTCAENPDITGVEAISTEVGNPSNAASDIFHCGDHFGITDALPVGTYTISVDAFNSSMAAVGNADALTNKTINDHNDITDLGTVTINLD
ncbi:MAG: hypothetical protein QM831_12335 [Kofleriaceae bacterium]